MHYSTDLKILHWDDLIRHAHISRVPAAELTTDDLIQVSNHEGQEIVAEIRAIRRLQDERRRLVGVQFECQETARPNSKGMITQTMPPENEVQVSTFRYRQLKVLSEVALGTYHMYDQNRKEYFLLKVDSWFLDKIDEALERELTLGGKRVMTWCGAFGHTAYLGDDMKHDPRRYPQ